MSYESPIAAPTGYIPVEHFAQAIYHELEKTKVPNYEDVLSAAMTLVEDGKVGYPSDLFKALHKAMPWDGSPASKSWHSNVERLRKALKEN